MFKSSFIIVLLLAFFLQGVFGQNENVFPVTINEKFPDITLTTSDNQELNLPPKSGKKTMLIFIRGKVTEQVWCPICQYQYLEMAEKENKENIREKYNMDIYFVQPYSTDSLQNWINAFPKSLNTINTWKNPKNIATASQNVKEWMEYCRMFFPHDFTFVKDQFELTLPVLFDPDRKVSNGLQIFTEEWGGTKVAQNVPTIFIIDEKGNVKFKYFSQYTNDRPSADFLIKYLEKML